MNLNPKRRQLLLWCAVIVLAMLVFPPMKFREVGRGYSWIFAMEDGLTINAGQLVVQWLAVGIIGGICYVLLDDRQSAAAAAHPDVGAGPKRFDAKKINIPAIRAVRVPITLVCLWEIVGAVGWLYKMTQEVSDPASDLRMSVASLILVSLSAVLFGGISEGLRRWIHWLHLRQHGCVHPGLSKWWRL